MKAMTRTAAVQRKTKETTVTAELVLDGCGQGEIQTGIGFLDHLLTTLVRFASLDLKLQAVGDLHVDDHHTAEDCALVLGTALDQALGERRGIRRFGHAYAPLDEALARAVVDLSGRPFHRVELALVRESLGGIACENIRHVLQSFAITARMALHVDLLHGENDHHRAEAAFKAVGLALRTAVALDGQASGSEVPSTKGVL